VLQENPVAISTACADCNERLTDGSAFCPFQRNETVLIFTYHTEAKEPFSMRLWFVILPALASLGAGYLLAWYFLKRANLNPSRKGLVIGACSMAGTFLLYFVLKQLGIDIFRPGVPNLILEAILALLFLCLALRVVLARLRCGSALADLGPSPLRTMFLALGVLMTGMGISGLFASGISSPQGVVGLSQGIWFLTLGLARNQICGDGICWGDGLLRWKRIAGYKWRDPSTLVVELRRPFWWQESVQLRVLPASADAVDQLMNQHVARGRD
jgi:hypothetical protein